MIEKMLSNCNVACANGQHVILQTIYNAFKLIKTFDFPFYPKITKGVLLSFCIMFNVFSLPLFGQDSGEADMPWLPEKKLEQDITAEEWEAMKKITGLYPAPETAPGVEGHIREGKNKSYYERYSGDVGLVRPETWADVTLEHKAQFGKGHLTFICDMPRIYYTDPTEEGRDSALHVFLQEARLTLDSEDNNSGSGRTYQMERVQFVENILAMQDILKEEGIYDDFARVWSMHKRFMLQKYPRENMDWSRDRVTMAWALTANMDDGPEKLHRLRLLQRATSMSMVKLLTPDGGGIHHNLDHISYSKYSVPVAYSVALKAYGTIFQLDDEVYDHMRAFVWAHAIATVGSVFPDNLCARSNLTPASLNQVEPMVKDMADQIDTPDRKFAALYLALYGNSEDPHCKENSARYRKDGVAPLDLNVHHSYNISAAAIHRSDDWVVSINGTRDPIKGNEMYVWPGHPRTWMSNSAFGSIQILSEKNDSLTGHGYLQKGWDYNHYAGVTAPVLPYQKLIIPLKSGRSYNYSEFCGGTSMGENGIWGMIFSRFQGHEVCRKSTFCFGNRITVLTSNIKSTNLMYDSKFKIDSIVPTHTTLFQFALSDKSNPLVINGTNYSGFPFQKSVLLDKPIILKDQFGNGYYVHPNEGSKINIKRSTQYSYEFANLKEGTPASISKLRKSNMRQDAIEKVLEYCEPIPGDFSIAYLDHDPKTVSSAAYTLYVQDSPPSEGKLPYEILRQDSVAHILKDCLSRTTGYAIFEAGQQLEQGPLQSVSRPSMVMVQERGERTINCSVSSTDVTYDEIWQEKTDPEAFNPEELEPMVLTFEGAWRLKQQSREAIVCTFNGEVTNVSIPYKDYMPVAFQLLNTDRKIKSAVIDIEEKQQERINIYPNPTNGQVNIQNIAVGSEINVYSLTGNKVFSKEALSNTEIIDLSKYTEGVYFIVVKNESTVTKSVKVVKTN